MMEQIWYVNNWHWLCNTFIILGWESTKDISSDKMKIYPFDLPRRTPDILFIGTHPSETLDPGWMIYDYNHLEISTEISLLSVDMATFHLSF